MSFFSPTTRSRTLQSICLFWAVTASQSFLSLTRVKKLRRYSIDCLPMWVFPTQFHDWEEEVILRRPAQRCHALLHAPHQRMYDVHLLMMLTMTMWLIEAGICPDPLLSTYYFSPLQLIHILEESLWNHGTTLFLLRLLPTNFSIHWGACLQQLLLCCSNGDFQFPSYLMHSLAGIFLWGRWAPASHLFIQLFIRIR